MSFKRILGRATANLSTRMQSGPSAALRTGPQHTAGTDASPRQSLQAPQSIQAAVSPNVTKPPTRSV
jgi:hypothetical protein